MAEGLAAARRRVRITGALGLHLRPAGAFVRLAQAYRCEVWVIRGEVRVDGRSILDLMSLAAGPGTTLEIEARGLDAAEAVAALADLLTAASDPGEGDDETKA